MAGWGSEKALYYDCLRNGSSIEYPRLPEISSDLVASPAPSAKRFQSTRSNFVSNNEKSAAAAARLTIPSQTHLIPPPAYQSESCESPKEFPRLEPLRSKDTSSPDIFKHGEDPNNGARQRFPFWRKKRGIILTVVLSNFIIIGMIFGGVLISRHVAAHSTNTGTEAATTTTTSTGDYASSTGATLVSTMLPATTMSASPVQWGPNSDGIQASGNATDTGGNQNNKDAEGASEGASGPHNSPGGGSK